MYWLDTYKNVIDTIVMFSVTTTLTGCAECSSDAICTKCNTGQYLDGVACKGQMDLYQYYPNNYVQQTLTL